MDFLDQQSILHDNQHGFRSKRSCESQLVSTINEIARNLGERGQVDIILLDFSKAFDKVPHRRLAHKLGYYGIRGTKCSTLQWIRDFLTNRTQQVLLEGHKSSTAPLLSGVPQGTVLGPLLFLLYINDLPERTTSDARSFADDCLLYTPVKSRSDTETLQKDLDSLVKWEEEWQMAFHPEKCVVIQVTNKRMPTNGNYNIHGHLLDVVDSSKYLGVNISKDLRWDNYINSITSKANRTLGFIRRNMRGCRKQARVAAYQGLVRPTLEYACAAWDPWSSKHIHQLEKVQRRAARFVTRNYHDRHPGSVTQMLKDLHWEPLQIRRLKIKLILLYKIQHALVAIPADAYLICSDARTRGSHTFRLPHTGKEAYRHSFFPRTIADWNSLPSEVACTPSLEAFKCQLDDYTRAQLTTTAY
ncbi:hypothetical protein FSP39_009959 [Pinctada imbricata]|uniref:Reverse transcriptase domain-containing protein n=1 Tax=Pinctada imbricata TaxID=66713 RepID=A0AA88YH56_PINIB|nr:hypothetical protein FSP39_009959 [Pinctada imbricata]